MFDMLMVGFDKGSGPIPVLTVGKLAEGKTVEIINAFQGEEAVELYKKLKGEEK